MKKETMGNPFTPERNIQSSYWDVLRGGPSIYGPYSPSHMPIQSPFAKHETVWDVLDAYNESNSEIAKAFVLGSMSESLRKNKEDMMYIIQKIPEAIKNVSPSLLTQEFLQEAIIKNPRVYDVLQPKDQRNPLLIDAYATGVRLNGCVERDRLNGEWCHYPHGYARDPDEAVSMFEYAISPACDKQKFYSVENYQRAYEDMLINGASHTSHRGNPKDYMPFEVYSGSTTFVHVAQIRCEKDPQMRARYKWAEAQAVVNNIDRIEDKIRDNPERMESKYLAEAVALAAITLSNPPIELINDGVKPQPEKAAMLSKVLDLADPTYWVKRGESLRSTLGDVAFGAPLTPDVAQEIDHMMEQAAQHPEMGVDHQTMSEWWELRGDHWRQSKDLDSPWRNDDYYLWRLSMSHPEMKEVRDISGIDDPGREIV